MNKTRILYLITKYGKEYVEYRKTVDRDVNKQNQYNQEGIVVGGMFEKIFKELTNTDGLYFRRSKEEGEYYICDYGHENDYELLIMDVKQKQLKLVTKIGDKVRVSRLGIGVLNSKIVDRLPNHTTAIVKGLHNQAVKEQTKYELP